MSSLRASCEEVLRANDRLHDGRAYTIPSAKLYPHQWAWDSAFAAIGWAHVDPARAWLELETLMASQWPDGRVPHIYFHIDSDDYFPGPDFWQGARGAEVELRSSTITQPPVWASCARAVYEIAGPNDAFAELLARFDASHRFFGQARDPLGWGLVAVVHPWESGLDNAPVWDGPMSRVDVSDPPEFQRRDIDATGDASMRPTDDHYLRYACLVRAIADDGYGPGPFAVYDPLMSSILARAERDLAWLATTPEAQKAGFETDAASRADAVERGLNAHLWDEALGRYRYHDANADAPIDTDAIGCYLPLWCDVGEPNRTELLAGLKERFWTTHPLPSTAPTDPAFDPRRYWRGPTWLNINWLLSRSLPEVAVKTLELVKAQGFREYYHPETGEGLGAEQFTWSAALALDLLCRPV